MVSIYYRLIVLTCLALPQGVYSQSAEDLFAKAGEIETPFRVLNPIEAKSLSQNQDLDFEGSRSIEGNTAYFYPDSQDVEEESNNEIPAEIKLAGIGARAKLPVKAYGKTQIFIRNPEVLSWNDDLSVLESKGIGSTEVYLVIDNEMTIVSVNIENVESGPDLQIPSQIADVSSGLGREKTKLGKLSVPYDSLNVATSLRDEASENSADMNSSSSVLKVATDAQYKNIAIQVIDERSRPEENIIYPVEGAKVSLIGSDFEGETNARGIIELSDVPSGSRFMVKVNDDQGRVLSQVVELATESGEESELFQVRTLSYRTYYLYSKVYDVAQQADQSSVCLRIMNADGSESIEGLRAEINVEGEGPYYFNSFGPDISKAVSSEDGRLCFFNVKPGLVEMSFYEDDSYVSSVTIPLLAGNHLEDDIYLSNASSLSTKIVALPSAAQVVYGDYDLNNQYFDVDFTEVLAVGENQEFEYKAPGVLGIEEGQTLYRGRMYGLVQGAEFETSLYSYDTVTNQNSGKFETVSPLLQRGFVEDLFNELYMAGGTSDIAHDPALGSVFVRHGGLQGEDLDQLKIRLVDQHGRDVQDPWYVGSTEDGFAKAVFFNLKPGIYTVVVESSRNHWIDTTTVPVDYWLTSLAQTGASLQAQ